MDKVISIPARDVRFTDAREDRYFAYPETRKNKTLRKTIRQVAKKYSTLYAQLRKDARFAAPKLAAALDADRNVHGSYMVSVTCRRPLCAHTKDFVWQQEWAEVEGLRYWQQTTTMAHSSLNDPTRIACYPTRADAARKREVVMTPGKFYAAIHDSAQAHSVQAFAEAYIASKAPIQVHYIDNDAGDYDEDELQDAWMQAYRNPRGFTSCMSDFSATKNHPARFYARPNNGLSLAYLTYDGNREGQVVARSIVNRKAGAYVRCYGDARLARALETSGLEACAFSALNGVQCNARGSNGNLVAPYLDGDLEIQWDGSASHCNITISGNYQAQETSGYASGGGGATCDECEERVGEDDITYSAYHDSHICDECREQNYTTAWINRREESLVRDGEVIHLNGTAYLDDSEVLSAHGFVWSEREQDWLQEDDAVYLEYLSDYVAEGNTVKLDIDFGSDSYALDGDTKEIELNGETLCVHEDYDGPEDVDDDEEEPASTQLAA